MVVGGKRSRLAGTFFEPTVATDVVVTREQSFGSVTPLYRFKTDEEAANDTPTLPSQQAGEGWLARRLFLQPRHRPHLARRRGPRIWHRRHQRGHHLNRDRPV